MCAELHSLVPYLQDAFGAMCLRDGKRDVECSSYMPSVALTCVPSSLSTLTLEKVHLLKTKVSSMVRSSEASEVECLELFSKPRGLWQLSVSDPSPQILCEIANHFPQESFALLASLHIEFSPEAVRHAKMLQ